MTLPTFGHPLRDRGIKVDEPITRARYVEKGRHLILGQRGARETTDSLILLGKCLEHTKVKDKYDANVWLDVSFPHAVYVSGTRGSGKSFDIGVLVEGLLLPPETKVATVHKPVAVLLFDLQNQFWTLARKPDSALPEDKELIKALADWGLQPAAIEQVTLYIPPGDPKYVGAEQELVVATADLTADDLCSFWRTDIYSAQGHLIATVLEKVASSGYRSIADGKWIDARKEYEIDDLIRCVQNDDEIAHGNKQVADAVLWRLESLRRTGLFRKSGIPVRDLLVDEQATVLLLRSLDDATKALVTGVLLKKVCAVMGEHHTRRKISRRLGKHLGEHERLPERVWSVIDEAHVVCPAAADTPATRSVIEYVKRGRDAGLSLLIATQQPSAIDTRILSQIDLNIIHRLTFDGDISAALARIPAALPERVSIGTVPRESRAMVRLLEPGQAIVGDAQCDRAIFCQVRPRVTAHGGAEPK